MKNIILTSGPRGAGKTTYSKDFIEKNPGFEYEARDDLLMELFGKTSLDIYTGGHEYASKLFFEKIEEQMKGKSDLNLIIDYWNGFSSGRRSIVRKLREFGADSVSCWKFNTPKDVCVDWFMKKEDSAGYSKFGISSDYNLYHKESRDIEEDGFDLVYLIDPLQLSLKFPHK